MKTPLRLVSEGHGGKVAALAALERGEATPGLLECPWDEVLAVLERAEAGLGFSYASQMAILTLLVRHPDDRAAIWATEQTHTAQGVRLPAEVCAELCRRAMDAEDREDDALSPVIWEALAKAVGGMSDENFYRVVTTIPGNYLGFVVRSIPERYSSPEHEEAMGARTGWQQRRFRAVVRTAIKRKLEGEGWDDRLDSVIKLNGRFLGGSWWWNELATSESEAVAGLAILRTIRGLSREERQEDADLPARVVKVATLAVPRISFLLPQLLAAEIIRTQTPERSAILVAAARILAAGKVPDEETLNGWFTAMACVDELGKFIRDLLAVAPGSSPVVGRILRDMPEKELFDYLMRPEENGLRYAVIGALAGRSEEERTGIDSVGPSGREGIADLWRKIRAAKERVPSLGLYSAVCGCCQERLDAEAWGKLEEKGFKGKALTDPVDLARAFTSLHLADKDVNAHLYKLGLGSHLYIELEKDDGHSLLAMIERGTFLGCYSRGEDPATDDEVTDAFMALRESGLVS